MKEMFKKVQKKKKKKKKKERKGRGRGKEVSFSRNPPSFLFLALVSTFPTTTVTRAETLYPREVV